jgi:hypothetical protein
MDRNELQELYDKGELDSPSELQRLRDEIYQYTGLRVPRSVADIEEWWSSYKSTFSRRIKPSNEMVDEVKEEQMITEEDTQ